jgi:hypothetical protein
MPLPNSRKLKTQAKMPNLKQRINRANEERTRRMVELVSPDRVAVRPALAVVALEAGEETVPLKTGTLFFVNTAERTLEFETPYATTIEPVQLGRAEKSLTTGHAQIRLLVKRTNPGQTLNTLRVHVADLLAFVQVLHHCKISLRTAANQSVPVTVKATGIEQGHRLYPVPPRGCPGRSLLTAMFHAPLALTFLELQFADPGTEVLEFVWEFREAALAEAIDPAVFRLNCVPVINQRSDILSSVQVTLKPTKAFEPIPAPAGQVITGLGVVEAYGASNEWLECRPWLGQRFPWLHRVEADVQYVVDRPTGNGDRPWLIGLVETGTVARITERHLNIPRKLADLSADEIAPGAPGTDDLGKPIEVVALAGRMLLPREIDPIELETEFLVNGWLAHCRQGDATLGLQALLQSTGLAYTSTKGRAFRNPLLRLISAARQVRVWGEGRLENFPLLHVELTLPAPTGDDGYEAFLLAVLERSLPLFAPPLTATQLTIHSAGGALPCAPRYPND